MPISSTRPEDFFHLRNSSSPAAHPPRAAPGTLAALFRIMTNSNSATKNSSEVSISEERMSARTAACVSLSIIAHCSLLIGMMIAPQKLTQEIKNIAGGDQKPAGAPAVELVSTPTEAAIVVDSQVDTQVDKQSDIVQPVVAVAKAPAAKPVKTVALPAKKESTAARVTPAPAPVIEVPQDKPEAKDEMKDETSTVESAAPEAVAEKPTEEATEETQAPVVSDSKESAEESVATPTTSAVAAEPEQEQSETPQPVAAKSAAAQTTSARAQPAAEAIGTGAGPGVGEPIRNASELRPLPGNPQPVYPARDRLLRKEGTALVIGKVTPEGRIADVKLERSSGSAQMDSASLQAFRSWRFQAGQEGWVRQPFQFRLVGAAREIPAQLGNTLKR